MMSMPSNEILAKPPERRNGPRKRSNQISGSHSSLFSREILASGNGFLLSSFLFLISQIPRVPEWTGHFLQRLPFSHFFRHFPNHFPNPLLLTDLSTNSTTKKCFRCPSATPLQQMSSSTMAEAPFLLRHRWPRPLEGTRMKRKGRRRLLLPPICPLPPPHHPISKSRRRAK